MKWASVTNNHIDRKGIPSGPGQGEYPSYLYGLSQIELFDELSIDHYFFTFL